MAGSARATAVGAAERLRRRHVGAVPADASPRRLSLVALLAALCLPIFLTPAHALRCICNDQSALSDCRWEEWTCTIDTSISACFVRRTRQADGFVKTDLGCARVDWNPTFCTKTTETVSVECCSDSDSCNEDLCPEFLETEPPPLSSSVPDGSGALSVVPTPTVSPPTPTPGDLLKCKCSRPLCDQSYCHTNFKCYKSISVHSNEEEEVMFGCYEKGGAADRFNACSGTLDTPTHKISCCNDNDMCNEDLDVTLGGSPTTPPVTQPPSPTGLRCACSPSRCPEGRDWCHSNYSCFREVNFSDTTNTFHVLGCVDTIEQVKSNRLGICSGLLDTATSRFKCCSDGDMCNIDLHVEPPTTDMATTTPPPSSPALFPSLRSSSGMSTGVYGNSLWMASWGLTNKGNSHSFPDGDESSDQEADKGKDDELYIVMSSVIILVMVVVTLLVVGAVGVLFLRYQREKSKVMSVDQFSPPSLKQLSNSSITCPITPSHYPQKDHTEINNYV